MTKGEWLSVWMQGYLTGHNRGYQERVAEENAQYPPEPVMFMGRWYDQALAREEWDRTATQQWPTDIEVRP